MTLVLVLLAGLTVILPAAATSLPDRLWMPGVDDGGDYDDLAAIGTDADVALTAPPAAASLAPESIVPFPDPPGSAPGVAWGTISVAPSRRLQADVGRLAHAGSLPGVRCLEPRTALTTHRGVTPCL